MPVTSQPKIAVFGTNRIRPTIIRVDCPIEEFETKLKALIEQAQVKRQPIINIDKKSQFWVDDFFENRLINPEDPTEGTIRVQSLYRFLKVYPLAQYLEMLVHEETFLKVS